MKMRKLRPGKTAASSTIALACLAFLACTQSKVAPIAENRPVAYVDPDGSHESLSVDTLRNAFPHMRFADGQVSLNDRCPVRRAVLNLRLPGLYVNGKPIGFC